jgi:hypothetical protein
VSVEDHRGALIEDDGQAPIARRYRYLCRCGKAGEWRATEQAARNDHVVHKHTADMTIAGGDDGDDVVELTEESRADVEQMIRGPGRAIPKLAAALSRRR